MTRKQIYILSVTLMILSGAFIGWGVIKGKPEIAIIAFSLNLWFQILLKKHLGTKQVITDELVVKINEKATLAGFRISCPISALVGSVFLALAHGVQGPYYYAGLTLSYVASIQGLLTLFLILYYRRKYK